MLSEKKWWQSYEQYLEQRTDELSTLMATAAVRERSEQARLAKLQGSLEQRLDRLTNELHWLIELTDIRYELDFFAEAEVARRRVRSYLVSLEIMGARPGTAAVATSSEFPTDVDDYWLPPATRGLAAVFDGASLDTAPDLVVARQLDIDRTNQFLFLVMVLKGRGEQVVSLLSEMLEQTTSDSVTAEQRAVWEAAAAGALGQPGRDLVLGWLRSRTEPWATSASHLAAWTADAQMLSGWKPQPKNVLKGEVTEPFVQPTKAATALIALAARGERAAAEWAELAVEPWLSSGVRLVLQRALGELVDEGTPAEAELLTQARMLRAQLGATNGAPDAPISAVPDPKASAGSLDELVRIDALGAQGAGPLCALAWRASPAVLAAVADDLERVAQTMPSTVPRAEVAVGDVGLEVTGELAAADVEALAQQAATARYPMPSGLMGKLRDDDNATARERERQRLVDRVVQAQAAVRELRLSSYDNKVGASDAVDRLRRLLDQSD